MEAAAPGEEGLPCAPPPAPAPPPRPPSPLPAPLLLLTPEPRGAGILRRRAGRGRRRQVRFRLAPKVEVLVENSQDLSERVQEAENEPPLAADIPLKKEPNGCAAVDRWHQPSSLLGTPVPHSTLALEVEAQALREQSFNARQAAEELVQRSFVTRCTVEARVGEGLNIPRDQHLYQDLVSLHVPTEELLSAAVQEKLALVRPHQEARKQELTGSGPDLQAFYDPKELFTETPFLDVEGLPPLKLRPRSRDLASTFFMYRKLQQWDS